MCSPIKQQWTINRIGYCVDQMLILKFYIVVNFFTSLGVVCIPMWTVWNLNMSKVERIVVTACFACGFGVCIIGIIRFVLIFRIGAYSLF